MVKFVQLLIVSLCVVLLASSVAHGRYLPTRSNEDSLDKLRDLLRDILESDKPQPRGYEGAGHYAYGGPKYLKKRDVSGWEYYDPSSLVQQPLH